MKIGRIFLCIVVIMLFALTTPAYASSGSYAIPSSIEHITNFESDIVVNTDSTMTVKESITVISNGIQIQRGIYRDFPTVYTDNHNNKYKVEFKVIEVLKNGENESYKIEPIKNGKRIRIGNPSIYLEEGQYTYTILYKTGRQLGFFEDHDELYWNVTGNEWNFFIGSASARIILPEGISKKNIKLEAYTGQKGSKQKAYTSYIDDNNRVFFTTTQVLPPKHALTIAVGWPKGFVSEPTTEQKTIYFIKDNIKYSLAILSVLGILVYYILIWLFIGRDPRKGTIIPLFEPPNGLSPASVRYIYKMKFDHKTLTAGILSMASKGYIDIEKDEFDIYKLTKTNNIAELPAEEKAIAIALLGSSSKISLSKYCYEKVQRALKNAKKELGKNYETKYFFSNNKYFIIGSVLSIIAVVLSVLISIIFSNDFDSMFKLIFSTIWTSMWSFGVIGLIKTVIAKWKEVSVVRKNGYDMSTTGSEIGGAIFITLFSIPFLIGEIIGLTLLFTSGGLAFTVSVILLIIINACFYHLLKAPTMQGRKIMDEIEGFKLFLGVAEKDRLNYMFPVDKTPELFEKYLPYALALDVEQEWAEQFSDVFVNMSDGQTNYSPSWYHSSISIHGIGDFTSSISNSFTGVISSSANPPPSSRSGFSSGGGSGFGSGGGGGSSGGGGGGGGGGGW